MINNAGPDILVLGFPVASPTAAAPISATALAANTKVPLFTIAGATLTLSDAYNGGYLVFTAAGGCVVTIPDTMTPGVAVMMEQAGAAAVSLVAGGTMTIFCSAAVVAPYQTADLHAVIGVTLTKANECTVYGNVT